jgi:drug/metabolite transporter (DMT)-like permease
MDTLILLLLFFFSMILLVFGHFVREQKQLFYIVAGLLILIMGILIFVQGLSFDNIIGRNFQQNFEYSSNATQSPSNATTSQTYVFYARNDDFTKIISIFFMFGGVYIVVKGNETVEEHEEEEHET